MMKMQHLIMVTTIIYIVKCYNILWPHGAMRWIDYTGIATYHYNLDIFFDRVVPICLDIYDERAYQKNHTVVSTGIFIDKNHLLTSYNAFRNYTKSKDIRNKFLAAVLNYRIFENFSNVSYATLYYTIPCARQVVPTKEDDFLPWHGMTKEHSPIHDLMVIRLNTSVDFKEFDPNQHSFDAYSHEGVSAKNAGPFLTKLAQPGDFLERSMKFASVAFMDDDHIAKSYFLRSKEWEEEDNVQVNCDEWMPKDWGHFICILNTENYEGVGSGSFLVSNSLVYGVGSFVLRKGNFSILVFTDVRPYNRLIFETCTAKDYM